MAGKNRLLIITVLLGVGLKSLDTLMKRDATLWTEGHMPEDLSGQTFIVTGASSGIGKAAAFMLAKRNAEVIFAVRNISKMEAALEESGLKSDKTKVMALSLDSLASVAAFADAVLESHGRVDGLLNNAGTMMPPHRLTADGLESQMATNHFGHFALTARLMPALKKAPAARVVTVSSAMHITGSLSRLEQDALKKSAEDPSAYNAVLTYSDSKLANVVFANELQRRLENAGVKNVVSLSCHPGYTATNLQASPKDKWWQYAFAKMNPLMGQDEQAGALPSIRALLDADVKGGEYFGPGGLFHLGGPAGHDSVVRTAPAAAAARFWEASEALTGVTFAV